MPSFALLGLTVAGGQGLFGPFAVAAGWQRVDFTLDIATLTAMDVSVEFSEDQVAWRPVIAETDLTGGRDKALARITTERLSAEWGDPQPAGFLRVLLDNTLAFLSSGGSLVVT
jgi:hypothetical protein